MINGDFCEKDDFRAYSLLGIIFMPLAALDVPPLKGHVNDYASMLTPVAVHSLE